MKTIPFKDVSSAFDNYDLLLFDLWGVIIEDEKFYPGVIDVINGIITKKKCFFVSNAPRPAFIMKDKLRDWGLENVTEDMIITSGDIAREIMIAHTQKLKSKIPTIYHLGEDQNKDILQRFDHNLTDDYRKANIFLISLYRDENQNLHEFDELLKNVAKEEDLLVICSNPDIEIPKGDKLRYCAGYFARKIEQNGGKVIYTGKPKKIIYESVFKKAGSIAKDKILMIGDTYETDVLGARNSGIHSCLVMTGNARKFHEMHDNMDDKLTALTNQAELLGMIPTFITKLVDDLHSV